jgi:hypothetical protein
MKRNLPAARRARDAGEQLSLLNERASWIELYREAIVPWFERVAVGTSFTGEDMREVAIRHEVWSPHHPNVWGANASSFIRQWLKDGRVEVIGFRSASSVKSHAHTYRCYRKLR